MTSETPTPEALAGEALAEALDAIDADPDATAALSMFASHADLAAAARRVVGGGEVPNRPTSADECPNPTAWADAMDDGAVAVPEDRLEITDEMVERAARARWAAEGQTHALAPWEDLSERHQQYEMDCVAAALRAALGEAS